MSVKTGGGSLLNEDLQSGQLDIMIESRVGPVVGSDSLGPGITALVRCRRRGA
jgi:hypothetical protein